MALDHYIPQVHLKNFYAPSLGQQMYAVRKSDLFEYTPNSKSVCRRDEGNTNQYLEDPRAVEDFLKDIEPNYNRAVNALENDEIDENAVYVISGFLSYVMTCSPTAMRMGTTMLEETIKEETRLLDKQGIFDDAPEAFKGKSVTELINNGDLKVDVDGKFPQAIGVTNIIDRVYQIGNSRWEILLNTNADAPFFTSDFPIAPETSTLLEPVIKTIPLRPGIAIRVIPRRPQSEDDKPNNFKDFQFRHLEISRARAIDINRILVRSAEDSVFSSRNEKWVKRFIAKNRSYRTTNEVNFSETENGKLFFFQHRIAPHNFDTSDKSQ